VGIQYSRKEIIYHIIANLDKLADVMKYSSRAYEGFGDGLSAPAEKIAKKIVSSLRMYYELFYSYGTEKVHTLTKNRDDVIREIYSSYKPLKKEEILILTNLEQLLEIISDLIVARMGLS
jgi:uncharacterized protein Yka (UPF0111/DUF47 family)